MRGDDQKELVRQSDHNFIIDKPNRHILSVEHFFKIFSLRLIIHWKCLRSDGQRS